MPSPTFPHVVVSARVHLHKAWSLGQREVVSFQSKSPFHSREDVRTYEEWATYPVDVLQLVCSQVGLAPAGSKHEMALRLVVFFQLAGTGATGGPGPVTAGGNDSTWSPSGGHAAPVASVPAVPLPVAHPVILPFQFTRLGPAAEVPDEVIRAVHDLEVRRLCAPGFGFVLA